MSKVLPLTGKILEEQVSRLNGIAKPQWSINIAGNQSSLLANYKFKNFATTWKFLNAIALPSHNLKHHPTITTTYNRVKIELTTHDAENQITMKDLRLALVISEKYLEVDQGRIDQTKDSEKEISLSEATRIVNKIIRS